MPIPRKSCDSCFKGRRRCDLAYPVCTRCQRNRRPCHYASPVGTPRTPRDNELDPAAGPADEVLGGLMSIASDPESSDSAHTTDFGEIERMVELLNTSVPNMAGPLGDPQPVSGRTESWRWAIGQIKSYPNAFSMSLETVFIHGSMTQNALPPPLHIAFGICAAYSCMTEKTEAAVFRLLDAEMSELINPVINSTLLVDLARMQATVLYQIIRLFGGDLKHRALAEQQHYIIGVRALQLLQRAELELRDAPATWEHWVLTESVRRTVVIVFGAMGLYSIFRHGICTELPTLSALPVSTRQSFWSSQEMYLQHAHEDERANYIDFANVWLVSSPRKLDPFERMILIACKGMDSVKALSIPNDLEESDCSSC